MSADPYQALEAIRALLVIQLLLVVVYAILARHVDCEHGAIANCSPCATARAKAAEAERRRMHRYWHSGFEVEDCPMCKSQRGKQ